MSSPLAAALFVAAAAVRLGASAVLVARLERLGARLGLSEALLRLAAALAADAPEVTSAVTALTHGQHDIGTWVVLGSNVFNLAALIGLGATLSEAFNSNTLNVLDGLLIPAVIMAGPSLAGALRIAIWYGLLTVTTIALALAGRGINRRSGTLIIAAYLIFAITVIASALRLAV